MREGLHDAEIAVRLGITTGELRSERRDAVRADYEWASAVPAVADRNPGEPLVFDGDQVGADRIAQDAMRGALDTFDSEGGAHAAFFGLADPGVLRSDPHERAVQERHASVLSFHRDGWEVSVVIEGRDGGAEAGGRLDAFEARERAPHLRLCDAGEDAVADIAVFGLNGREE